MNKIGIHYAYWGHEWDVDLSERIQNAAHVGFEVIDITPPEYIINLDKPKMRELKNISEACGVELSFCIGFPKEQDMSSSDYTTRQGGIEFSKRMMEAVSFMGGKTLSGILYSWWPYLYTAPISLQDKRDAWKWGVESIQKLMPFAESYDIRYAIELVNRFEQYILNSVDEGLAYIQDIGSPRAGLLVDVFHANIEEDSIPDAIRKAGNHLFHLHISENTRRLPGFGKSIDWDGIVKALKAIDYQGNIVMEPFIEAFYPVGNDLRIWRDLETDLSKEARDEYARQAIAFIKEKLY